MDPALPDPGLPDPAAELAELLARHAVLRVATPGPSPADVALRGAFATRRPGRSLLRPAVDASVAVAHRDRVDALDRLVRSLAPGDWTVPTRLGCSVQELLAHLVGQLERTVAELAHPAGAPPAPDAGAPYDHWGATAAQVGRFGVGDPTPLVTALAEVNRRLGARLAVVAGDSHDLASPPARALAKVFELWMHADDVRLALGRPVDVPGGAVLGTMCTLAADAVPVVMAVAGAARPGAWVRLVLTGVGGGVWRRPLALAPDDGAGAGHEDRGDDVTVVAEAHRFCRLFHAQVTPGELDAHVEGDRALGAALLAVAGVLAERT